MADITTIKINFKGGIISPGQLHAILVAANDIGVRYVSFGLRQQLLIEVSNYSIDSFTAALNGLQISYQTSNDSYPNILSSYPAEEVFISNNWLGEGVYKDIFDAFDYEPRLKVNISDSNQSFTPLLTGNINWVASNQQHFWHLLIRFPKTNIVYEWEMLTYTNHVSQVSKAIEQIIFHQPEIFVGNDQIKPEALFLALDQTQFILKAAETKAVLPSFNLPYYEGLNRYNGKVWLGIYQRDELFSIKLLKDICLLSLETKIGQLCSTPWKSLIVKGIEEQDRHRWNQLLEKHYVNVRHALNELNFQVEDNCKEGIALKQYLIKQLNESDLRTFGLCIGIKIRNKSEVFSSILVRRKPLIKIGRWSLFFVYDILCAKDFNPNERTGKIFSSNNPKILLGEQLRRAVIAYYKYKLQKQTIDIGEQQVTVKEAVVEMPLFIHQCIHCLTVYDEKLGEEELGVAAGTSFENLSPQYCCPLCEAPKTDFVKKEIRAAKIEG